MKGPRAFQNCPFALQTISNRVKKKKVWRRAEGSASSVFSVFTKHTRWEARVSPALLTPSSRGGSKAQLFIADLPLRPLFLSSYLLLRYLPSFLHLSGLCDDIDPEDPGPTPTPKPSFKQPCKTFLSMSSKGLDPGVRCRHVWGRYCCLESLSDVPASLCRGKK